MMIPEFRDVIKIGSTVQLCPVSISLFILYDVIFYDAMNSVTVIQGRHNLWPNKTAHATPEVAFVIKT